MRFFLYILPLLILGVSCADEKVETKEEIIVTDTVCLAVDSSHYKQASKIDIFFKKKFKRRLFNGAVLFADKGKIIHKGAYGYTNWRKKETLSTNSVFQLASVSKPLTAYGVLYLIQEGKIGLEDTIQKYLPDFPYEGITIKHLLIHRSGLTNYMYFTDKHWPDWNIPITNSDVVSLMTEHKPDSYYKPNRRYNYSNTGYILLAHIVEEVSGMSFARFMKKNIFKPLGMNDTKVKRYSLANEKREKVVGHKPNFRPMPKTYLDGTVGDKGIYSTVEDMFKLDRAISEGKLVKKEWLDKAFVGYHRDLRKDDNYGLGWRINAADSENKIVYHRGWWKGFRTYFIRVTGKDQTIIVLNNSTYGRFLKNDELIALLNEKG